MKLISYFYSTSLLVIDHKKINNNLFSLLRGFRSLIIFFLFSTFYSFSANSAVNILSAVTRLIRVIRVQFFLFSL
jgi:hypothetical protein